MSTNAHMQLLCVQKSGPTHLLKSVFQRTIPDTTAADSKVQGTACMALQVLLSSTKRR